MSFLAMHMPRCRTYMMFLLVALAASGCARRETDEGNADTPDATGDQPTQPAPVPEPPKEVSAVTVTVKLSPAAEQKMKALGERVKVEIIYGGDPSSTATLPPNELGMIELGKKVLELDGSGTADLPESEVDRSRLDQVVGQPQILVNTTSARKTTSDNLLACGFYWDTLSVAGENGVKIDCSLLTEIKQ